MREFNDQSPSNAIVLENFSQPDLTNKRLTGSHNSPNSDPNDGKIEIKDQSKEDAAAAGEEVDVKIPKFNKS